MKSAIPKIRLIGLIGIFLYTLALFVWGRNHVAMISAALYEDPAKKSIAQIEERVRRQNQAAVEEYSSPATTEARKRQLLEQLINNSEGQLKPVFKSLLNFIDLLPVNDRSGWLARLGRRCASEYGPAYFEILNRLPSGNDRTGMIMEGVNSLDPRNLERLLEIVDGSGDSEEIEWTSTSLKSRGIAVPDDHPVALLGMLSKVAAPSLRLAIAHAAGTASASVRETSPGFDAVADTWGNELAGVYADGQLSGIIWKENPEIFLGLLRDAPLNEEQHGNLLSGLANVNVARNGIQPAMVMSGKLSPQDADLYDAALGRQLARRCSQEAGEVLKSLPAGRSRDLMTVQLVNYLRSKGDPEEAERWAGTIEDEQILKGLPARR